MKAPQAKATSGGFEFINVTNISGRERRRNNYLARAHAAKLNRQNHKAQAERQRGTHTQRLAIQSKPTESVLTLQDLTIGEVSGHTDTDEDGTPFQLGRSPEPSLETLQDSAQQTVIETFELPTPRSISPTYGGLHADTFDLQTGSLSACVGQYCKSQLLQTSCRLGVDTEFQC